MGLRSTPQILDVRDDSPYLGELMAFLERASRDAGNRRIVIGHLRALLATLEQASPEDDAALIPAASLGTETAQQTSSEYGWGYRAFAAGEVLNGWTDTPFAQGWLAAATDCCRLQPLEPRHPL